MQDIAVAIGATYFSEKTGDDLSHITLADLGHVRRAIVGKDKTVLMKADVGGDTDEVNERVAQLWDAHKAATKKADKDFIAERIASLTGGIGVIFVGGNTDLEQKELYDRVDDAVCAVKSAMEEGILAGGGHALNSVELEIGSRDHATRIVMHALGAPINQILINAGLTYEYVYGRGVSGVDNTVGYNVKTGEYGDMIKMGVIDPLKVTRSAFENAVSVAVTILSTNAIITMARSYDAV
jgi:chaperonin GroEL